MAMIKVLIDGAITEADESELLKLEGGFEDDNERTTWVQYHLPKTGTCVHRSAHVTAKRWPAAAEGTAAALG